MNKKTLTILTIAALLIITALIAFGLIINSGKQQGQREASERNSIFHTVPEGGDCRPEMGDCETGLTCGSNLKCEKP